jgi:hypothetical protein
MALLRLGVSELADAWTTVAVQIAKANPPNAAATRRLVGASTASSYRPAAADVQYRR